MKKYCWVVYLLLCLLLISACAGTKPAAPGQPGNDIPLSFTPAKHLVFICLDGWGGAYVSKADMPAAKRMMGKGASCLNMKCVMPSNSWPNWTSLFSGTPPEYRDSDNFPTIFTVIENSEQDRSQAFFYEWDELRLINRNEADSFAISSSIESALSVSAYIIENKPVFTAVIFNEPDSTGHSKRWGSKAYYATLAELDTFVAIIEQGVKDAGIYGETVFVLSADHGGALWGHGFNLSSHRKIPLIIYGKGIKEGFAIPSPVSICDLAPTMAKILGLAAPPIWTGKPLTEVIK